MTNVKTRFEHADPILNVRDMAASLRYYVDVLGFRNAKWGNASFAQVSRDGACISDSRDDLPVVE